MAQFYLGVVYYEGEGQSKTSHRPSSGMKLRLQKYPLIALNLTYLSWRWDSMTL